MILRHFVFGKFTEPVVGGQPADFDYIVWEPPTERRDYDDARDLIRETVLALTNHPHAELKLLLPMPTGWIYARVLPSIVDRAGRPHSNFHAVLLTDDEIHILRWQPWLLDFRLTLVFSGGQFEMPGVVGISPGVRETPVRIDIELDRLAGAGPGAAEFPRAAQLAERIRNKEKLYCLEQRNNSTYAGGLAAAVLEHLAVQKGPRVGVCLGLGGSKSPRQNSGDVSFASLREGTGEFPLVGWQAVDTVPENPAKEMVAGAQSQKAESGREASAGPRGPMEQSETELKKLRLQMLQKEQEVGSLREALEKSQLTKAPIQSVWRLATIVLGILTVVLGIKALMPPQSPIDGGRIADLEQNVSDLTKERDKVQTELNDLKSNRDRGPIENSKAVAERIDNLQQENEKLKGDIRAQSAAAAILQASLDQAKRQQDQTKKDLEQAKGELDQAKIKIANMQKEKQLVQNGNHSTGRDGQVPGGSVSGDLHRGSEATTAGNSGTPLEDVSQEVDVPITDQAHDLIERVTRKGDQFKIYPVGELAFYVRNKLTVFEKGSDGTYSLPVTSAKQVQVSSKNGKKKVKLFP
jgi:hypothetical protein